MQTIHLRLGQNGEKASVRMGRNPELIDLTRHGGIVGQAQTGLGPAKGRIEIIAR